MVSQKVLFSKSMTISFFVFLLVSWCLSGEYCIGGESLETAPGNDGETLLYVPFDEPDEVIVIGEKLAIEPIYVRMAADYRPGRFGQAIHFDGRPDFRQCLLLPFPQRMFNNRDESRKDASIFAEYLAPHVIIDNIRGYTLECWIYPQALQRQMILAALNTAVYAPQPAWQIDLTEDGRVRFTCGSGLARFELVSNQTVPLGQWSHVAIVCRPPTDKKQKRDKGGEIRILINGSVASEAGFMERATIQRNTQPGSDGMALCIGGPGPEAGDGFFDGRIDEVRISKIARDFEPDPAVMIESRKELFLDDTLIATMNGVKRVVNQPRRYEGNPLLKSQGPWDEKIIQHMGLIYDEKLGLYRCWYRGFDKADKGAANCYAYSRDGLQWVQPKLGLVAYNGSTDNNIVRDRCNGFYFADPLARLGEPYICMTAKLSYGSGDGPFKQILVRSEDGLRWQWGKVETVSGYAGWPYDRIRGIAGVMGIDRPLMHSPAYFRKIEKLVIADKEGEADIMKPYHWARVGWDLLHWQDPVKSGLTMTEKNNEAWYGFKCFDMGSIVLGISDAYHGTRPGRWIDFQLACSRDGYHWSHVANQDTFFPIGPKGSWDGGMVWSAVLIETPGSDEWRLYYNGSSVLHDLGDETPENLFPFYNLGVAFLRKDGFVSLERDGNADEVVVVTRPIRFRGSRLFVNADAANGSISVELCAPDGAPLSGFERDKVKPLTTDSVRHELQWAQRADVSPLEGRAVVLKFYLSGGAKLYAYQFNYPDPHVR
jgi:hypothetical protein